LVIAHPAAAKVVNEADWAKKRRRLRAAMGDPPAKKMKQPNDQYFRQYRPGAGISKTAGKLNALPAVSLQRGAVNPYRPIK
jgi:hypothetical protein